MNYPELLLDPDVRLQYDLCSTSSFPDETSYLLGLLAFVHACDMAYMDENASHTPDTIAAVALALADINRLTGHDDYASGADCPVSADILER